MNRHSASWPKIFAIVTAGVGASSAFSAWGLTSSKHLSIICDWQSLAVAAVLFIMSFVLACGFDWARRILLLGVVVVAAFSVVKYGLSTVMAGAMSIQGASPEETPLWVLSSRLEALSSFFLSFGLGTFGVLVLSHPDVVSSFRRASRGSEKA